MAYVNFHFYFNDISFAILNHTLFRILTCSSMNIKIVAERLYRTASQIFKLNVYFSDPIQDEAGDSLRQAQVG
jgi:hypothetical protein